MRFPVPLVRGTFLRRYKRFLADVELPTARRAKHLQELAAMVAAGHRAVMLSLVHRSDCEVFDLARDIDPAYAAAFAMAHERGVEMRPTRRQSRQPMYQSRAGYGSRRK